MTDAKVHLCFTCGQRVRIPHGKEHNAKCPNCETLIYKSEKASHPLHSKRSANAPNPTIETSSSKGGFLFALLTLGIVVGVLSIYATDWGRNAEEMKPGPPPPISISEPNLADTPKLVDGGTATETSSIEQSGQEDAEQIFVDRSPKIQPLPFEHGEVDMNASLGRVAPFKINTPQGSLYFLKAVDALSGDTVFTVKLKGGLPFEADVPLGTYEVKYAVGSEWYGEEFLFGDDTQYNRTEKTFTFSKGPLYFNGVELTLSKVLYGNLETEEIQPSEF